MPFALFPAINAAHFGGHSATLGLLAAAPAVGGIVGSSLSGPVARIQQYGRGMLIAATVWGVGLICFGLSSTLWPALAFLVIAGAADVISVILRGSLVPLATPDEFRGRVSAADYIVGVGVPQLGNFRAGVVASLTSPAVSAVSGGVAVVLSMAVIGVTMPGFVRFAPQPVAAPVPVAG